MEQHRSLSGRSPWLPAMLALVLSGVPALAQQLQPELGTLTCTVAPSTSARPIEQGQARDVLCQFRPGNKGAEETYVGTLQFVGQEAQLANKGVAMFVVKAPPTTKIAPGLLQQKYSTEGAAARDRNAPLSGNEDNSIILQSATEHADRPNLALGQPPPVMILSLELKLQATPA
jgi:hypothetical protein